MPTSKELLEMADREWKNREERKGIHDKVSWTSGWISGYLTRNPQAERELLRPEVLTFALLMERKLRKHDKERGDSYKTSDVDYLLMRLREEVKELNNEIEDDPWNGKGVSLEEAVDVGNFAMMIGYHDYQFPMDVFISELEKELREGKDGEQE